MHCRSDGVTPFDTEYTTSPVETGLVVYSYAVVRDEVLRDGGSAATPPEPWPQSALVVEMVVRVGITAAVVPGDVGVGARIYGRLVGTHGPIDQ